jgi:hypothetical protein
MSWQPRQLFVAFRNPSPIFWGVPWPFFYIFLRCCWKLRSWLQYTSPFQVGVQPITAWKKKVSHCQVDPAWHVKWSNASENPLEVVRMLCFGRVFRCFGHKIYRSIGVTEPSQVIPSHPLVLPVAVHPPELLPWNGQDPEISCANEKVLMST